MQIDLTYSDIKTLISSIKNMYRTEDMHDFEAMDLIELEFRLSQYLFDAYKESKFKPLTENEIKKLEDKHKNLSVWRKPKDWDE